MTTAREIIGTALKKLGVVGTGQLAGNEDYNDALLELNGMIGQWQINRWMVYQLVDLSFTGSGAQTYSIGPGATVNVTKRPDRIERAYMVQLQPASPTPISYPLQLIQSYEDYAAITLKTLSTWPWALFYDPVFPQGLLYPWPIPTSAYEIHVLVKAILQRFDTLDEVFALPDAYYEAMVYNLCLRLSTSYPGSLVPEVEAIAMAALENVKSSNFAIASLRMPKAVIGKGNAFNIYSGMND